MKSLLLALILAAQVPGPTNGLVNDQGGTVSMYEQGVAVQTWSSTGISALVLTKSTGTVVTNAVTINALSGVITDDTTDIAVDTTRADITLTDSTIVATSIVTASICKKPADANVGLIVAVTPGAGSAVLSVRNVGTGALTTNNDVKICFRVSN